MSRARAPGRRSLQSRRGGEVVLWLGGLALCLTLPFAGRRRPTRPRRSVHAGADRVDGQSDPAWAAAEKFFIGIDIFSITFRALHDDRTLYLRIDDLTDSRARAGRRRRDLVRRRGRSAAAARRRRLDRARLQRLREPRRGHARLDPHVAVADRARRAVDGDDQRSLLPTSSTRTVRARRSASKRPTAASPPRSRCRSTAARPSRSPRGSASASTSRASSWLGQTYLVGYWPADGGQSPSTFGDVALAALRCNDDVEEIDPQFPADWVNDSTGGPGWLRSGAGGCGVANGTGGSGEAACLVRGATTLGLDASLVSPWFSLLGQSSASVSYRAVYVDAAASSNRLDLEARTESPPGRRSSPGRRRTASRRRSGDGRSLELRERAARAAALALLGRPRRRRYRRPGRPVRLVCSPNLFSDSFESGLTTHWDAEAP